MEVLKRAIILIPVIAGLLFLSGQSQAVGLGAFGDRIFQFQQKLANRGNVLAQYKLGTLYEFGISVPPSTEKAMVWYKKAAAKDYQPAINRLVYLEIVKSGFNEQKHGKWFEELNALADTAEANALILLGQMHHNGVHVETDLYAALDLLSQASSLGHTEVDSEIDVIKRKIEGFDQKANIQQQQTEEAKAAEKAAAIEKEKEKAKADKKAKAEKKAQAKKAAKEAWLAKEKAAKEDKRKRYEEAMRKLKDEAKLLEQQQQWAEE